MSFLDGVGATTDTSIQLYAYSCLKAVWLKIALQFPKGNNKESSGTLN